MRFGQMEPLPVLSQNTLPHKSTGAGQVLGKQLMLLKIIWRASQVLT